MLVAGIGQEPRLGRWLNLKKGPSGPLSELESVKNGALVFVLTRSAGDMTVVGEADVGDMEE